ncbi:fumarylacetoacetate hydrolase [Chitinophaga sp. YR573]|uniref:fumarylacetoacetate hydrolase family protein n=1 Tax=Chitinophaga sp. YR573 TaxID=1881040 RepID=UPI0008C2E874|nr:fumarylacetoacetate hydrolase family protein [Chitinophaga sp. YR573]SEW09073.1 fumarylacetoacetate hydrolase [Chitinophaga sp. YR573]
MKLVTYLRDESDQLAILVGDTLYNTQDLHPDLPGNMQMFLLMWDDVIGIAMEADAQLKAGKHVGIGMGIQYDRVHVIAPVPFPSSCRDGYAFRQHVATARRNRKMEMIPEFDQFPIFYFTNHNAIQGPGDVHCMPDHFENLDFELEAAVVICRPGRNVTAAEADDYIAGFMIMNDMSARVLQMDEMKLNLGPAKGKDFSTVIGPMLVTPDELEHLLIPARPGHTGKNYNLKMTCKVNGIQVSEGNMGDMNWTFAEIIERCAYGANILPGDVIGSGTVGTGCFLELNGTGKLNDPNYPVQWLQPGDVVEMEIDGLGTLSNTIVQEESDFSILKLKK